MFLKNKNFIFKIRRSKVTDYAALTGVLIENKKCHKHMTNAPKGIGLAQDTFEER